MHDRAPPERPADEEIRDARLDEAAALQAAGRLSEAAAIYRRIPDAAARLAARTSRATGSSRKPTWPKFLILGPPRSGTTWLKQALRDHPGLWLPGGEPNYFANRPQEHPQSYFAQFPGGPVMAGAKSPSSLAMTDDRIELCASLLPDLKLIALIRDPAARAWSHLKMVLGRSPDPADLRANEGRIALLETIRHGRYRADLRRWAGHFPAEQILLLDFARVRAEPQAAYDKVLAFLGAQSISLPPARVRPTTTAPPPELAQLFEAEYAGDTWDVDELEDVVSRANAVDFAARRAAISNGRSPAEAAAQAWRGQLASPTDGQDAQERLAELLTDLSPGEAVQLLAIQARRRPGQRWSWLRMAETSRAAGDQAAEIDALVQLYRLGVLDNRRRHRLAGLLTEAGRGAEAAVHLQWLAEAQPGSSRRWKQLAAARQAGGDLDSELCAVLKVLELEPANGKIRGRAVTLLKMLGRTEEGRALAREALGGSGG